LHAYPAPHPHRSSFSGDGSSLTLRTAFQDNFAPNLNSRLEKNNTACQ
jgi:hypothetical protein